MCIPTMSSCPLLVLLDNVEAKTSVSLDMITLVRHEGGVKYCTLVQGLEALETRVQWLNK